MKSILFIYTEGLYMNEGKDRVMVMHVENFTKSLYQLPVMHFIKMMSTFNVPFFSNIHNIIYFQAITGF